MSKNKPGRNEPCWCGSGRKFKHCHYGREDETPLPFGAIANAARKAGELRICLYPHASKESCGKVISAHTLQRSRVLKEIANAHNHVYSFHPPDFKPDGRLKLQKRGWHNASTFTAFCDKHDADLFAPLETQEFTGTPEQCFLIAYRSVCWELHRKIAATQSNPAISGLIDRGAPGYIQQVVQHRLSVELAGLKKGMEDSRFMKTDMDIALAAGEYGNYAMHEVLLEKPMLVASTGSITPNRSICGETLQVLHDVSVRTQWLSFGVDVGVRGVSVVFVWRRNEASPAAYMTRLMELTDQQLPEFLVQFFFAHCENTYFRDTWWNALPSADRIFLEKLMENSNPYYYPPQYELHRTFGMPKLLKRRNVTPI